MENKEEMGNMYKMIAIRWLCFVGLLDIIKNTSHSNLNNFVIIAARDLGISANDS